MFGFESPEARKMMKRPTLISLFVVLVFAAVMIAAFVFQLIPTDKALAGGVTLMVLNSILWTPRALKARQIEYDYKARRIEEKYGEQGSDV